MAATRPGHDARRPAASPDGGTSGRRERVVAEGVGGEVGARRAVTASSPAPSGRSTVCFSTVPSLSTTTSSAAVGAEPDQLRRADAGLAGRRGPRPRWSRLVRSESSRLVSDSICSTSRCARAKNDRTSSADARPSRAGWRGGRRRSGSPSRWGRGRRRCGAGAGSPRSRGPPSRCGPSPTRRRPRRPARRGPSRPAGPSRCTPPRLPGGSPPCVRRATVMSVLRACQLRVDRLRVAGRSLQSASARVHRTDRVSTRGRLTRATAS